MSLLKLADLFHRSQKKIEPAIVRCKDLSCLAIKPERWPGAIFRNVSQKIAKCVFVPSDAGCRAYPLKFVAIFTVPDFAIGNAV